jgi:hypothetical protein
MPITIIEFMYSLAALRTHDEIIRPKHKVEPWLWAHYCFGQDADNNAFAEFLPTGEEPPYQPVSGVDQ